MIERASIQIIRERLRNMGATFICGRCRKEKTAHSGSFYIAKDATYCMGCAKEASK